MHWEALNFTHSASIDLLLALHSVSRHLNPTMFRLILQYMEIKGVISSHVNLRLVYFELANSMVKRKGY
jgi:hypothetical protein